MKHAESTVLLIGPPNVGKSVLFNLLTGMNVSYANYPGTTVDIMGGKAHLGSGEITLVDVPGTYTLDATNEAEKIAVEMLQGEFLPPITSSSSHFHSQGAGKERRGQKISAVLCIMDAYNLESSIYLLMQVLQYGYPTIAVLNRSDLAREKGIEIDISLLSRELGIPVIPTVAVSGEGVEELKKHLMHTLQGEESASTLSYSSADLNHTPVPWKRAEEMSRKVSSSSSKGVASTHFYRRSKWGLLLVQPWPGIPLAILILGGIFALVVGLGMGLRQALLLPLFRDLIIPQITFLVQNATSPGIIQDILIGEYGFLVKGLEWPFALVLPYVISFYTGLTILEDSGYMPRLGGLLDGLLNKLGLGGSSVIPLLLGYGCGIPAILSSRALETRKERILVTTMISVAVPCVSQTGAFIALMGERSIALVLALFLLSIAALIISGFTLDKIIKGERNQTVMELPELFFPRIDVLGKKIFTRFKSYIFDGALPMVGAVGIAAVLYESGIMASIGKLLTPLVTGWLGLPQEASVPLVLGVLRRELAVLPLLDMELNLVQLFVGASVALFYVPCIAIIATVAREFNIFISLGILLLTSTAAFLVGGIILRVGMLLFNIIII